MQYVELALPLVIRDLLWLIVPAVNFELTWCATFNLIYAFVDLGIRLLLPPPPHRTNLAFPKPQGLLSTKHSETLGYLIESQVGQFCR